MSVGNNRNGKKGTALLTVLIIVMAVTVISLGFLSRSDVDLICGENMVLHAQMDYLAESGLEHAKGLTLNPQDVDSEYWTGAAGQQLVAGSDDYYDVNVVRLGRQNYQITCDAYRVKDGEQRGRSSLKAELRLDPCIAFWAGGQATISQQIAVNGDVYCGGNLSGSGYIDGDAFASGIITAGNVAGRANEMVAGPPVAWPGLQPADFSSTYCVGASTYPADIVDSNVHPSGSFSPSPGNPAGVRYCSADVELQGGVSITGMLVVDGNLAVSGPNNVIIAVKNFPALLVSGDIVIEDGATMFVNGLAQIGRRMVISAGAGNIDIDIIGALCVANGGIEGVASDTISIDLIAAPAVASVQVWPVAGAAKRWGPAAGALFRSIQRK
ncbi:MAG: hypothetical protein ACYS76_01585 [Planctomycetota bacterium]|jgi:hypothetical protein